MGIEWRRMNSMGKKHVRTSQALDNSFSPQRARKGVSEPFLCFAEFTAWASVRESMATNECSVSVCGDVPSQTDGSSD